MDMECFNLFSPEGRWLGWVWNALICFSPEGRWLGLIWNALICSVLRVGGRVGYGML